MYTIGNMGEGVNTRNPPGYATVYYTYIIRLIKNMIIIHIIFFIKTSIIYNNIVNIEKIEFSVCRIRPLFPNVPCASRIKYLSP